MHGLKWTFIGQKNSNPSHFFSAPFSSVSTLDFWQGLTLVFFCKFCEIFKTSFFLQNGYFWIFNKSRVILRKFSTIEVKQGRKYAFAIVVIITTEKKLKALYSFYCWLWKVYQEKFRSNHLEVFYFPVNFAKFSRKFSNNFQEHLCRSFFFNKVAGLRLATLLKKRLQQGCFSVNFTTFFKNTLFYRTPLMADSGNYFS